MRGLVMFVCVGALGCTAADPSGGTRGPADALIEFDPSSIGVAPPREDTGVTPRPDTGTTPPPDVARRCTGVATSCSLIAKSLCLSNVGCSLDKDCSGYPGSCYAQFDSYSCTRIKGCYWSSYDKKCSGSATPCEIYSDKYSCEAQRNCSYTESCTGLALSCESMTVEKCLSQAGCRIE